MHCVGQNLSTFAQRLETVWSIWPNDGQNLTKHWAIIYPITHQKKCELGKFYVTLNKCWPISCWYLTQRLVNAAAQRICSAAGRENPWSKNRKSDQNDSLSSGKQVCPCRKKNWYKHFITKKIILILNFYQNLCFVCELVFLTRVLTGYNTYDNYIFGQFSYHHHHHHHLLHQLMMLVCW